VRRLRDPLALALWVGIPLVIGGLMSLASGGDDEVPRAHLLIADQDQSAVSKLLVGALSSEQARVFRVERVDEAAGRARLDEGDGSALLVIPEGFGEGLLLERPTRLELVTNPAQRIMPGLVRESLAMLSEAAFYAHRLFGSEVRELAAGPPGGGDFFADARIAEISARINARMRGLERWLFPPAIELETAEPAESGEPTEDQGPGSFAELFFPTTLFMALLFVAMGLSDDLWRERSQGTLYRARTTPQPIGALFAGKVLAGALVTAAVTAVGLAIGTAIFDVTLAAGLCALAWGVAASAVLTLLMTAVQVHAASQRAGNLMANVLLFPLLMLGGAFFPFEVMPDWMARLGGFTPNGFALVEFKWLLAGGFDPARIARDAALAAALGAALFLLCTARLRGRFGGTA
jgi:ABC-type Na+ efflux pump permease subunit